MTTLLSDINWWLVALVAIACYVASSIKVVTEKERALLIWLGKIKGPKESGPHLVFRPFYRLEKATKNTIKVDFGTLDAADVKRVNEANTSQNWFIMEEPIRINWGDIDSSGLTKEEKKPYENDPLAKRLTTDPHLYFTFRVFNLTNLVEEAGSLSEAIAFIKDTCTTALQEFAGKTFLAKAIQEVDQLSNNIQERVEDLVGDEEAQKRAMEKAIKPNRSWGVDVLEVRIKAFGTSHAVNTAVSSRSAKVAEAAGDATATELKAKAEKMKLTEEGEGRAAAIKAEGDAEASAIQAKGLALARALRAKIAASNKQGGELIVRLDALVEAIKNGKVTILPSDLSLLTTATSVKAVLDTIGNKEERQ